MRFFRHIPRYIQSQLVNRLGGFVSPDTEIKVLDIGAPATVSPGDTTASNTALRLDMGDYVATVFYNRVDMQTFWSSMANATHLVRKLVIREANVKSIHDILGSINDYTGFDFKPEEVVNSLLPDGSYSQIIVQATSKCLWFTGQVILQLQHPTRILQGTVITQLPNPTAIASMGGASVGGARFNPGLLTYDINYTDNDILSRIPQMPRFAWSVGSDTLQAAPGAQLAAILAKGDGLPWVYNASTQQPFNLYNSAVIYNGPVGDFTTQAQHGISGSFGMVQRLAKLPRTDQKYVLALLVSATAVLSGNAASTNLDAQVMFIHYGGAPDVALPDKPPVHHWPLNRTRKNIGTDPGHPEFAARGRFKNHGMAKVGLVVDSYVQGTGGTTYIGTDLAVDRDFTLMFEFACHESGASHPANAFQFYKAINDTGLTAGRLIIQGLGQLVLLGTWPLDVRQDSALPTGWPHRHHYALTRRGNEYTCYIDGVFYGKWRGTHQDTAVFNGIYSVPGYSPLLSDIRYYDYALSGDQVRRYREASLSGTDRPKDTELPVPLHRWTLDNTLNNSGRSTTKLNSLFTFRKVADGKNRYWAARASSGALGVSLPTTSEFTLCWDQFCSDASTSYSGFLGGPYTDSRGHVLKIYGITPFLEGGGGTNAIADPAQMPVNTRTRMALRGRNGHMSFYANGQYVKSQAWTRTEFNAYTHFGLFTEALKGGYSFRNLTYYDQALSDEQLWLDANKDW